MWHIIMSVFNLKKKAKKKKKEKKNVCVKRWWREKRASLFACHEYDWEKKKNFGITLLVIYSLTLIIIHFVYLFMHSLIIRPNCVNILVTETSLVASLVKLLLHDLGPYFSIENVYSSNKVGKDLCFSKIKEKYGSKCTYVVIGDGQQEEVAAKSVKSINSSFWRRNLSCIYLYGHFNCQNYNIISI